MLTISIITKHLETWSTMKYVSQKREQIDKLTEKINNNTNCSKDWWKTLKTFIKPNQTSAIPPLNVNSDIYSDNTDKATKLNDYFTEQSSLDDSNANLPADLNIPDFTLNSHIYNS